MRWFLRSAVAAAGFGTIGALAFAQQPLEMRPSEKVAPASARALSEQLHALPTTPMRFQQEFSQLPPLPARVEDVSPKKPAPAVTVQNAVPTTPAPVKNPPVTRVSAKSDDSLSTRPAYLPPALPVKLPAPPSPGPLPPIPLAPPVAVGPRAPAAPRATSSPFGFPSTASAPGTKSAFPPVPPLPAAGAAAVAANAACAAAAAPCLATQRLDALMYDPVQHAFAQDGPVRVRGWLDGGYVYNSSNPNSKFNGPDNSVDRSAEPMFNQGYFIVDSPLTPGRAFSTGFRVDALFGLDHYLGQSRGLEVDRDGNQRWNGQYYGLALPQAYLEGGNDLASVKLGHFYSPIGYEMLPSTANFFYSHAYSYQFGQPITHWGGLMTTHPTRNWQFQLGVVNGWDTLVGRTNDVNVLAGLKYTPDSKLWWSSFSVISGDQANNPANLPNIANNTGNRTRYSWLVGLTPGGPCGRWEYVFHHYYGWQDNGVPSGDYARWYGVDQYLYYRVSNSLKLGTRFEWFRDEDGTRVGLNNRPANPNNPPLPGHYFALTGGVNYSPTSNLMIRPEIRWDFTSDTTRPAFNDGKKNNQLLIGCDVIWQF